MELQNRVVCAAPALERRFGLEDTYVRTAFGKLKLRKGGDCMHPLPTPPVPTTAPMTRQFPSGPLS